MDAFTEHIESIIARPDREFLSDCHLDTIAFQILGFGVMLGRMGLVSRLKVSDIFHPR